MTASVAVSKPGLLSEYAYIRAIAVMTMVMGGIVAFGALTSYSWPPSILWLLIYFGGAVAFIFVFSIAQSAFFCFVGVAGMSLMLGFMIGPVVAMFAAPYVMKAVVLTVSAMVIMSAAGILYPHVFRGWGPFLMAGLVLLIAFQFGQLYLMAIGLKDAGHMPILTWAGIGLFLVFTAYDWSQALENDFTMRNAVEASGGLILNAVNLFLRILETVGPSIADGASAVGDGIASAADAVSDIDIDVG